MKVITYLGFTLLSILIQLCFMDYIQEKIPINENPAIENVTSQKKVDNLLTNISSRPHALYYRTQISRSIKESLTTDRAVSLSTTDISTTILDILYDYNTTDFTTLETISMTDFDNSTEIAIFETKNKSSVTPNTVAKKSSTKFCGCNLLFEVCDINCCCDPECSDMDIILFQCEKAEQSKTYDGCISHLLDCNPRYGRSALDALFCVVKTNLPDKLIIKQPDASLLHHYNKWIRIPLEIMSYEFKKSMYKKGDPIWLLKNGIIYYLDFAIPMVNNYCTDRAPIMFLKEEKIRCMSNLKDLEVFHIKNTEESMVISAVEKTLNSSTLNCSNLHCVNWTILTCNNSLCRNYNNSTDKPICKDGFCTNLALNIEYNFYYYDLKIVNATIKLHIQNLTNFPFMMQEITISFIMANSSEDRVIEFSGNPGYNHHLPVIISTANNNHTENFFNNSSGNHYICLPENQDGVCVPKNSVHTIKFGENKRTKCRYVHTTTIVSNNTSLCTNIQESIKDVFGITNVIVISPYGNPSGIEDQDWIKLQNVINEQDVYGEYSKNSSKLRCYNLINRLSLLFIFANVNEKGATGQNKILQAKSEFSVTDVYFDVQDISTVLTIDINFVDISKPNLYIYAGSPHLNIHLPNDFFFPSPNNKCTHILYSCTVSLFCYIITLISNKITLQ